MDGVGAKVIRGIKLAAQIILGPGRRAKDARNQENQRLAAQADAAIATLRFELVVLGGTDHRTDRNSRVPGPTTDR